MGNTDSVIPGDGYSGYHVLKIEDNGPGQKAGLQAYFDYIVAINDIPLYNESDNIINILQQNRDKEVKLTVYSSKTKNIRQLKLLLESNWGGKGLLGASIRFCPFEGANENVWHVLSIQPHSPAQLAGLQADTDYIIGADAVLASRDDFFNLIENHDGQPVKLYVYSKLTDSCREVHLTPNSNWGGVGLLGCDIGYGYLHRIPTAENEERKDMPVAAPLLETCLQKTEHSPIVTTGSDSIPLPHIPCGNLTLGGPTPSYLSTETCTSDATAAPLPSTGYLANNNAELNQSVTLPPPMYPQMDKNQVANPPIPSAMPTIANPYSMNGQLNAPPNFYAMPPNIAPNSTPNFVTQDQLYQPYYGTALPPHPDQQQQQHMIPQYMAQNHMIPPHQFAYANLPPSQMPVSNSYQGYPSYSTPAS